jgi:hypothetical protein
LSHFVNNKPYFSGYFSFSCQNIKFNILLTLQFKAHKVDHNGYIFFGICKFGWSGRPTDIHDMFK